MLDLVHILEMSLPSFCLSLPHRGLKRFLSGNFGLTPLATRSGATGLLLFLVKRGNFCTTARASSKTK